MLQQKFGCYSTRKISRIRCHTLRQYLSFIVLLWRQHFSPFETVTMDQLKSTIKNLRRKNASHRWFIPDLLFSSVITEDAIREALVDWPSYQREETVEKVKRGKKIFCILILLGHAAQLAKFIEADQLEDTKLPFKSEILIQEIHLSEEEARDFDERQWELVAPTFRRSTLNRRLGEGAILPFTQHKWIGKGAFGDVYEVTLDPSHQELGEIFPEKVLLKLLLVRLYL